MAWQQHAAAGKLQPRKYPGNWAGAAAASSTNQLLLPRRQRSPRHTNGHLPQRLPAKHLQGSQRGCLAQERSPPALELQLSTRHLHGRPLYTCNTGHTKTWFGIPGCFCKSCNKTCICKASCSYRLIPPQHNLVMLIIYIYVIAIK